MRWEFAALVLDLWSLFCRLGQAGGRINNILYRISQNEGIKVEEREECMGNCAKRDPCLALPSPLCIRNENTRHVTPQRFQLSVEIASPAFVYRASEDD